MQIFDLHASKALPGKEREGTVCLLLLFVQFFATRVYVIGASRLSRLFFHETLLSISNISIYQSVSRSLLFEILAQEKRIFKYFQLFYYFFFILLLLSRFFYFFFSFIFVFYLHISVILYFIFLLFLSSFFFFFFLFLFFYLFFYLYFLTTSLEIQNIFLILC